MDYLQDIHSLVDMIKAQGYESICFWLPAYNTGGGTYYFCELAKYLTENTSFNIYYMDFLDGYPSSLLKGTRVSILEYHDEDTDFPIQDKCIIVTNSTRAIQLKRMRPDNKLLFWHYETVPCAWNRVFIMNEAKAFFELCRAKKAMVFHDWSGWDIMSQECGVEYEKQYLPLFIPPKTKKARAELINEEEMNIVWLGRLGIEKVYSIYNLLDCISKYNTQRKIIVHIVGDGVKRDAVVNYCEKYKKAMTIKMVGTVPKRQLDKYLIDHADIVFGMGLSAFEGAALGIPSVIVKLDTQPIEGNEFIWLYNTKEYCAGILPSQRDRFDVEYSNIWDVLDSIYIFDEKEIIGQKCYYYYMENLSSFDRVIYCFLSAVYADSLTMEELESCLRYIPYNHIQVKKRTFLGKTIFQKVITT